MSLEARELGFGYPSRRIGSGASFRLAEGEVLCLLGPNGSGKTTLFKTLLGLLPAQAGEVLLDGRPVARMSRQRLARSLAYVPQAHEAYFPFSVLETVLMGRTAHVGLFSTPGPRDADIAARALETLGIDHLADAEYTRISGGERQLTLIARALAQEPRIVVMDEPTANLDFGNQTLVLERVAALARAGIGVVMATHDPDHAFLCAHRVAMLHEGALSGLGRPEEVITPASLRELYGVDVDVVELDRGGGVRMRVCVPAVTRGDAGA